MVSMNGQIRVFSNLRNDANFEQKGAKDEASARAQEPTNGDAQDATQSAEEELRSRPFN